MTAPVRLIYAAAPVCQSDQPPTYAHIGLEIAANRIGPARLFIVSGRRVLEDRPEIMAALLAQCWQRHNGLNARRSGSLAGKSGSARENPREETCGPVGLSCAILSGSTYQEAAE